MRVGEVVVEEAGELREPSGELVGGLVEPPGPAQRGGGAAVGARRAAEPEVDPARGERLQGAELLGDGERGVVGQHDPARAEPDAGGMGGEVGQDHGRGGAGHPGHGVVLGDPVALVAAGLGEAGDRDGGAQGVVGGAAAADGDEVQHHVRLVWLLCRLRRPHRLRRPRPRPARLPRCHSSSLPSRFQVRTKNSNHGAPAGIPGVSGPGRLTLAYASGVDPGRGT